MYAGALLFDRREIFLFDFVWLKMTAKTRKGGFSFMRHLMNPLDFTVEELDQLFDLANDIERYPAKYAHACDGKKARHLLL